jgi:hypothetical protein
MERCHERSTRRVFLCVQITEIEESLSTVNLSDFQFLIPPLCALPHLSLPSSPLPSLQYTGIIGSGVPETYEMLRIIKYVKSVLVKYSKPVVFPVRSVSYGMPCILRHSLYKHHSNRKLHLMLFNLTTSPMLTHYSLSCRLNLLSFSMKPRQHLSHSTLQ